MADQSNNVAVLVGGAVRQIGGSDRVQLTNGLKVSGGTVDFTGATLSGVATDGIADAIASIDLDGSGNLTETALASLNLTPSGAVTIKGGGASSFGDDTGSLDFGGTGALALTGVTTLDVDASGALQINSSGGAISVGNDSVSQAVNIGTGGTRTVTMGSANATLALNSAGGAMVVTAIDNNAAALKVQGSDSTARLTVSTVNNAEAVTVNARLHLAAATNFGTMTLAGTAGEALAAGDVVSISGTAGKVFQADSNHATAARRDPVGVCTLAAAGDGSATSYSLAGVVEITFDANVATSDIGSRVYLSDTLARASLTAPSGAGEVWMLGKLVACPGGEPRGEILFRPQYLYTNP